MTILMTGGGTGGHVIPAVAVARELRRRGHKPYFIGTREGFEARLVPQEGFEIDFIRIGGLKRMGLGAQLRTLASLPSSVAASRASIRRRNPSSMFSMGGYAAGPPMIAGWLRRLPMVLMEPNAMPGLVSRRMAHFVRRALLSFPEAEPYFPSGRSELTGLPVREEFFTLPARPVGGQLTILITGGSRGSQRLNETAQQSWPLFRQAGLNVRFIHQTGAAMRESVASAFTQAGMAGTVTDFIADMPLAFAEADLIVCRSGAGAVAELAAAGKPSILVPFPYAADDHQLKNAEAMVHAGAARLVRDSELSGQRLFDEVTALARNPGAMAEMASKARRLARPGAAQRAADVLEEVAR